MSRRKISESVKKRIRKQKQLKKQKEREIASREQALLTPALKKMKTQWRTTGLSLRRIRINIAKELLDSCRSVKEAENISKKAQQILEIEIKKGDVWVDPKTGRVYKTKEIQTKRFR